MHIRVIDNIAAPYSISQLRRDNPQVSFPQVVSDECAAEYGVYPLQATPQPSCDPATQKVVAGIPVFQLNQWVQVWEVVALSATEQQAFVAELQADIVAQTQNRLDAFARTRNYDSILSACTYATSTVPKFQGEGQCAVNARDTTWATLYTIMAEVEAGTRPMPTGFADIEPLLPALEWPV